MEWSIRFLIQKLLQLRSESLFKFEKKFVGTGAQLFGMGRRWILLVVQPAVEQEHVDSHVGGPEMLLSGDEPLPDGMALWRNHDLWIIGRVEGGLRTAEAVGVSARAEILPSRSLRETVNSLLILTVSVAYIDQKGSFRVGL
jgi:hypothetical protein